MMVPSELVQVWSYSRKKSKSSEEERFTNDLGNTYTAIVCAAHRLSSAVAAKNVGQCAAQAEETTIATILICVGRAIGL
jgi:hypothetical protein